MLDFGITLKPDLHHERLVAPTRQAEGAGFGYGWIFAAHVIRQELEPLLTLAEATLAQYGQEIISAFR